MKKVLEKYFSGNSTPEEIAEVTAYLSDNRSDLSLLQEVIAEYTETDSGPGNLNARDRMLLQLRSRLYPHLRDQLDYRMAAGESIGHEEQQAEPVISLYPVKRIKWWVGVAAAVLLISLTIWFVMAGRVGAKTPENAIAWQAVDNVTGNVRAFQLPDGSKIWLHPQSHFYYTRDFGQGHERRVRLEGEAFFDVAHDSERPFIIHSGGIQTRVLGTAFNVEAYGNEDMIRVSLVRGKVAVEDTVNNNADATVMTAGHLLVYQKNSRRFGIDTLAAIDTALWTDGTMVLQNIPVTDALKRISNRFGFRLAYDKNVDLQGKNVNGVFRGQTVDEMLRIVLFISGYQYRLKGQTIEVYKK